MGWGSCKTSAWTLRVSVYRGSSNPTLSTCPPPCRQNQWITTYRLAGEVRNSLKFIWWWIRKKVEFLHFLDSRLCGNDNKAIQIATMDVIPAKAGIQSLRRLFTILSYDIYLTYTFARLCIWFLWFTHLFSWPRFPFFHFLEFYFLEPWHDSIDYCHLC